MFSAAPFAHRFRLLALLRAGLVAGALYDLGFALLMVAAPQLPARLLALPLPQPGFYLSLLAVLLAMVGTLYLLAAWDPRRYSGIVAVAICGRLLGALAFVAAAQGNPDLSGLYLLAAVDFAFAVAHAACWLPIRS